VRTAERRSRGTAVPKTGVIIIEAQGIPADVLQTPNLRAVRVFLASVTFADDSQWHEDVRALSENTNVEGGPSDYRRGTQTDRMMLQTPC
jgi:hypothetical protein